MKKILKEYLKALYDYKTGVILVIIICFACLTEKFLNPIIVQKITDDGILKNNYKLVIFYGVTLIIFIGVIQILQLLQNWLLFCLKKNILHRFHIEVFDKILHLDMGYFVEKNSAEIIDQINMDTENIGILCDKSFVYLVINIISVISGFAGLVYLNWKMALCILICIPIKYTLLNILSAQKEKKITEYLKESQKLHSWMADRVAGIREIKLFNRYEREIRVYSGKRKEILRQYQSIEMVDFYNISAEGFMEGILTAVFYLIGGYFICKGYMSIGKLLAFISYSRSVIIPISMIMNLKMILSQVKPSFTRLHHLLELDVERNTDIENISSFDSLRVENICFSYGKKKIMENVSLMMKKGEIIGIIGENGSGKSTLLYIILRLYKPESGNILINEKNYLGIELNRYRQLFSVVTQSPYLFQETIRENLDFWGRYSDKEIINVFYDMGMEELYFHFPKGLDTKIGVNASNISGGEKQKLSFLRAILNDTPIIIFDESTSNYDEESEKWFYTRGIKKLKNKLIIIVTHQYGYLEICDRVYAIGNGTLKRYIDLERV